MGIRVTVVMDEEVNKKLRSIQAKRIQNSQTSVSFSKVLNDELKKRLKI